MKIQLRGVTKKFGSQTVLDAVDFEVEFAHTLALIGPSGGGKSTLLRLLALFTLLVRVCERDISNL